MNIEFKPRAEKDSGRFEILEGSIIVYRILHRRDAYR